MSEDKKYNGWSNYETWCCKLWLDNDEGIYNYWNQRVKEISRRNDEDDPDFKENIAIDLADELKNDILENNPLEDASMYSDLMNTAIKEINFYEIAKSMVNDYFEE